MATKVKMRVDYLKSKVEEAKKKYLADHADKVKARAADKVRVDKEMVKYRADLLKIVQAHLKAGGEVHSSYYYNQITFNLDCSKLTLPTLPEYEVIDPGKPNTNQFDVKLALLDGCSEPTLLVSVDDNDWSYFLV